LDNETKGVIACLEKQHVFIKCKAFWSPYSWILHYIRTYLVLFPVTQEVVWIKTARSLSWLVSHTGNDDSNN